MTGAQKREPRKLAKAAKVAKELDDAVEHIRSLTSELRRGITDAQIGNYTQRLPKNFCYTSWQSFVDSMVNEITVNVTHVLECIDDFSFQRENNER